VTVHTGKLATRVALLARTCLAAGLLLEGTTCALGADLGRLIRAYPDFLQRHDERGIKWTDGTYMIASDGKVEKSYKERLKNASIADQLLLPYRKGALPHAPSINDDPGRFRNVAFFDKMYGNCERGEVQRGLVRVQWLPNSGGGSISVTSKNGIADKLRSISDEIERLPAALRKYAVPSAGAFNCRTVQDTGNRSMHAWGAAIDLNTEYADYWLWSRGVYRNRIPMEIVNIFERYGFIWGGKWGHYDTMHFEYRPELLMDDTAPAN
jgi:hypothetical protein